jgi:transcription antitermination factor NusG
VNKAWYVLRSKPHNEFLLYEQLKARHIDCYFPRIKVSPINPRSAKIRPYFPSYIFVNCDIDELGINTFQWMPHALGLVCFDGIPAAIPSNIIEGMKKNIGNIRAQKKKDQIKPGTPVTITEGPFQGYEGIFDSRLDSQDRVKILLELIDYRKIPVEMKQGQIKPKKG